MTLMGHVVIIMFFFSSRCVSDSNGLAGHVQSWESEKQPVDLVWPLHHLHRRLPVSWSSGHDEVRKCWKSEAEPVFSLKAGCGNIYCPSKSLCKHSTALSFDMHARFYHTFLEWRCPRSAVFIFILLIILKPKWHFFFQNPLFCIFRNIHNIIKQSSAYYENVITALTSGLLVFRSAVAYLCGHLHTLGGLMPVLHSRHPQGTLELELGDWMDNRRYEKQQECKIFTLETLTSWEPTPPTHTHSCSSHLQN